jgi:hypothetical protein
LNRNYVILSSDEESTPSPSAKSAAVFSMDDGDAPGVSGMEYAPPSVLGKRVRVERKMDKVMIVATTLL